MSCFHASRAIFDVRSYEPILNRDPSSLTAVISDLAQLKTAADALYSVCTRLSAHDAQASQDADKDSLAGSLVARIRADLAATNLWLVATATERLSTALRDSVSTVGHRQRFAVTDTALKALSNLGYEASHFDGAGHSAVEARRGEELVLIAVADRGAVEIDYAGIATDDLNPRQTAFRAEMSRLGIDFLDMRIDRSGDRRHSLIAAAESVDDRGLACAAVLVRDAPAGGADGTSRLLAEAPVGA